MLAEGCPWPNTGWRCGPHACSITSPWRRYSGRLRSHPRPDENGPLYLGDEPYVVSPPPPQKRWTAEIACAGEQLLAFIQERLGRLRTVLHGARKCCAPGCPRALDRRVHAAYQAQRLDTTNWLSRHTHLRRIIIPNKLDSPHDVIHPGQFGRVCPYETPEGLNMGRVFTISVGAESASGRSSS
jgi:hypothetical protein